MQIKEERWIGNDRHELIKEVSRDEIALAISQQSPTEILHRQEDLTTGDFERVAGEHGVEVIVVATSPAPVTRCLRAYHAAKVKGIRYALTVVDASGEEFTTCHLMTLSARHGFKLIVSEEVGELPAVIRALGASKVRWFVLLSEHAQVYDGWLEALLSQADEQTAMVTACSNRIVPIAQGISASAMAASFRETVADRGSLIPFPRDCCLLVNRKALDDCGGFDLDYYRPGGGQILDFYLEAHRRGYLIKLAERCWVYDSNADYRGGATWEPQSRHGFYRFLARHGKAALLLQDEQYQKIDFPRSIAAQFKPSADGRPEVVFVFREADVCGLVLAVAEICNGLNELGWNAYFACTRFEEPARRRIPMNFAPVVAESEVMLKRYLAARRDATVVATLWCTAEDIWEADLHMSCKKVFFVQDDERRFRYPSGAPYIEPEKVEAAWRMFDNRVVNSGWVKLAMVKMGLDARRIGIGVDTMRFRPLPREEDPIRVMVHSRPSTPRRGWPFVRDVLNRASRSAHFEVVTYDQQPEGLEVEFHQHLGKVSPDELAAHMGKADIFFEGSEFQGWGMQSLEAMSCGCALVSTDNEGIHEFATGGYDCVIVQHGKVEVAASVICHLTRLNGERHRLQERARQSAMTFSWPEICNAWDRYLRGIA